MTKHQEYYHRMLQTHKDLFAQFRSIHDLYVLDPTRNKAKFDQVGQTVTSVIIDYENRLCAHSEKGRYAAYSNTLADKFWALIRADYPKIDDVGIEVTFTQKDDLDSLLTTLKKTPL